MAKRIEAYVDTAAFIAFLDRSDTYHPMFAGRFADPPPLVTTPLVIAEGHAWFLKRYDAQRAMQFLAFIEALSVLRIETVGKADIDAATTVIRRFSDQSLTIADAVGLWCMKRWKVTTCWSTDRHLTLMGASLVIYP